MLLFTTLAVAQGKYFEQLVFDKEKFVAEQVPNKKILGHWHYVSITSTPTIPKYQPGREWIPQALTFDKHEMYQVFDSGLKRPYYWKWNRFEDMILLFTPFGEDNLHKHDFPLYVDAVSRRKLVLRFTARRPNEEDHVFYVTYRKGKRPK